MRRGLCPANPALAAASLPRVMFPSILVDAAEHPERFAPQAIALDDAEYDRLSLLRLRRAVPR
jgi:hypothetical protein